MAMVAVISYDHTRYIYRLATLRFAREGSVAHRRRPLPELAATIDDVLRDAADAAGLPLDQDDGPADDAPGSVAGSELTARRFHRL
jgi:hypothetical protein